MPERTFVIVGAGAAAASAVSTLLEEGFDGRIVMVGDESQTPYERPPLSKEYMRGEMELDQFRIRARDWYEDNGVELHLSTRAEHVNTTSRELQLRGGAAIPFDSLLIATGVRNRWLKIPGRELSGVLELRTQLDAMAIRNYAMNSSSVAVIGMGFIGAEVAASLRDMGLRVTVVEAGAFPMERVLGEDFGWILRDVHTEHGVQLIFNDGAREFKGVETVDTLWTTSGVRIECDMAVIGVGTIPNSRIAEDSEIVIDDGIHVDAHLETAAPGVFAAGDIARVDHPLYGRVRTEHFDTALRMGATAARNMLGKDETFNEPMWFWSDQFDQNIQMAGVTAGYNELVVRGVEDRRSFVAFYLKQRRVIAALALNRGKELRAAMKLIKSQVRVEPDLIRDESFDLSRIPAGN
jgi:3-phenylpropionate/trans-cinnamate dioxygenase ferredoxin reductase subunit